MTKYLVALVLLISSSAYAQLGTQPMQTGTFPCEAFQMQQNGMLAVVKSVAITSNGGSVQMNPGMSFGPGVAMMGVNVYALYQQNCH